VTVLIEFAEATGATAWTKNTNWLGGNSVCSWFGITCNAQGLVIRVSLRDNGLQLQIDKVEVDIIELLSGLTNLKVSTRKRMP